MKRIILTLAAAALLCSSCSYYQVYHAAPASAGFVQEDAQYVYKNSDIRIVYNFWSRSGIMSYTIYNTSKKPIYIDWQQSSLIRNSQKVSYYSEGTGQQAVAKANERISFLPPGSFVKKRFYKLISKAIAVPRSLMRDTIVGLKKAKIADLPKGADSYVFRNYVTYSFAKDLQETQYVDNEFYIDRIFAAPLSAVKRDDHGKVHYTTEGPGAFYLKGMSKQDIIK